MAEPSFINDPAKYNPEFKLNRAEPDQDDIMPDVPHPEPAIILDDRNVDRMLGTDRYRPTYGKPRRFDLAEAMDLRIRAAEGSAASFEYLR